MATNQNSNKRAKVGLAIFAVLGLANIVVHGGRMLRQQQDPLLAPAAVTQPGTAAAAVAPAGGNDLLAAGPEQFIDKQTAELKESLEKMKKRLDKIPPPLSPPDLSIKLMVKGNDYFKWQLEGGGAQGTSKSPSAEPALEPMTVVGNFRIGNRTKLLVRTASGAFVIDSDDDKTGSEVLLVHEEKNKYVIKDSSGKTRVLQLETTPENNLQEVVDTLRGRKNPPKYQLIPGVKQK